MNRFKYSVIAASLFCSPVFAHDSRLNESDWHGHDAEPNTWVDELKVLLLNPAEAAARISVQGDFRVIRSDGKPDHTTGRFPNRNNPNGIRANSKTYRVAANPQYKQSTYALGQWPFGVAINGVPFDPGAAEFWQGNSRSGWQYEALGGAVNLGVDRNNAHVQPNGTYHYHGLPTGILEQFAEINAPALIGYAADGFPIYGPLSYSNPNDANSPLIELKSSYKIKVGNREGGPGGRFDGGFVEDYGFVQGLGDLDDCNGRTGVTPDYPQGTYYYVVTGQFPFIPRCFHGEPDRSFIRGGPGGMNGGMNRGMKPGRNSQNTHSQVRNTRPEGSSGQSIHNRSGADDSQGPRGGGPPIEAYEVCKGKLEGDLVNFKTPRGHVVEASCERPDGDELFAVPKH